MTADGEQTRQDAERTNDRAKSLGRFIKGILQAAEGIGKTCQLFLQRTEGWWGREERLREREGEEGCIRWEM